MREDCNRGDDLAEFRDPVHCFAMTPDTLEKIYAAKRERRKQLAALPINERVQIIEKLHKFGLLMRKAKEDFRRGKKGRNQTYV